MRTLSKVLLITIALTASAQGLAVQKKAGATRESTPPALTVMQDGGLTLAQAIERVRRKYNGRIVDAKTRCSGNRETHEIKVLTQDGKVKTERVPGKRCG